MRLIDMSQPIFDGCPNCPDHPPVKSEVIARHEEGGWHVEKLTLSNHTGSHVDAPLHKIAGGASLDEIPLDKWVGLARIADLRDSHEDQLITAHRLSRVLQEHMHELKDQIILMCTGWGYKRAKTPQWLKHSPQLAPDGAEWLVQHKVRGVGIDHYSVGGAETHEILLKNNVWIVEELHFPTSVFALTQPFQFWSLPINLKGHTGAFCRPVAVAPS